MRPVFITGIGTGVGKTLVSAIVAEALGAYYWKPVQAGFDEGTDAEWVAQRLTGGGAGADGAGNGRVGGAGQRRVLPELYKLKLPASPHIAARAEGVVISMDAIVAGLPGVRPLVVEGAGGLFVPLNDRDFMVDLALRLDATVILVSRNYLGSINHSLLTAEACKVRGVRVAGWVFNDQYGHYEAEIAGWSGLPVLGSVPFREAPDAEFVREQAALLRPRLLRVLAQG
jgi:dethiobiotin synthetase